MLERAITRRSPFLCLVDSDRTHPSGSLGSTARSVQRVWKATEKRTPARSIIGEYVIIPFREAENLVPAGIYRDVFSENTALTIRIDAFFRIQESDLNRHQNGALMRYVDIKQGHHSSELRKASGDRKSFLQDIIIALASIDDAKNRGEKDIPVSILDGLGSGPLDLVIERSGSGNFRSRFARLLSECHHWDDAVDLVSKILAYAAAPRPLRA